MRILLFLVCVGLWAQAPMPGPFIGGAGGGGGGTPGGSDTQVQFNDSGAFGGDAGFTYNKTTDVASLTGGLSTGASPPTCTNGTAGVLCLKEGTAATGEASAAVIYPKTDHLLYAKLNNAAETAICTIASGCGGTSITGPYWPWGPMSAAGGSVTPALGSANRALFYTLLTPYTLTVPNFSFYPKVASGHGTVAIYNSSCAMVANGQANTVAIAGNTPANVVFSTPPVLTPGKYYLGFSSEDSTVVLYGAEGGFYTTVGNQTETSASYPYFYVSGNDSSGTTNITMPASCTGTRVSLTMADATTPPAGVFH